MKDKKIFRAEFWWELVRKDQTAKKTIAIVQRVNYYENLKRAKMGLIKAKEGVCVCCERKRLIYSRKMCQDCY